VCWISLFSHWPMFIVCGGICYNLACSRFFFSSFLLSSVMEWGMFVVSVVQCGCCCWGGLCVTGFSFQIEYAMQHLPLTMDFPSHVNCTPVHVKLGTIMRSNSSEVSVLQTLISSLLQVANTSEYSLWTENKILAYEIKHALKASLWTCTILPLLVLDIIHHPVFI
jgi:hypothetical protein